ncbi:MAG: ABC transporter permease [Myxococcota bacterium]
MIPPIEGLGRAALYVVGELGRFTSFGAEVARATLRPPLRVRLILDNLFAIGVRSLSVVCASAVVVGLALGLQLYHTLTRFGAEAQMGAVIGISLIREFGPVISALLVTGRAGSAVAAEIGSMVQTEQLDGLRMMSVDPIEYVVSPKALALLGVMPLLSALFIVIAIAAAYIHGVTVLGLDGGAFLASLESAVEFHEDVAGSLLKSTLFGALIGWVATYRGFTSAPTSEGVSFATTQTVVIASVGTLALDYFVNAFWGV